MEEKRINRRHQVTLVDREQLNIDGVINVESFDDREIVLETQLGGLIIQGDELHITELNLESANLIVGGFIKELAYTGDSLGKKGKGLLAKLFK